MKRQKFTKGAIVKIPIGDGYHTYGRLMLDPYIEVIDARTKDDIALQSILEKPILFTVCFFYRQAISNGTWEIIEKVPFDETKIRTSKQFRQDDFDIQKCKLVDMWGDEQECSLEECRGHERLAVWSPQNIVRRILDHYEGRPNATLQDLSLKER